MQFFDDALYRPDLPSQRYRLLLLSSGPVLAGLLPWLSPLRAWLSHRPGVHLLADVVATGLHLGGMRSPYPSAAYLVQALLTVLAAAALLKGSTLQLRVIREFAPGSRTLRWGQWLLALLVLELLALCWAWPTRY